MQGSPPQTAGLFSIPGKASPTSRATHGGRSARVCYYEHMRLHIVIEDELVAELDRRAGARQRSAFIGQVDPPGVGG